MHNQVQLTEDGSHTLNSLDFGETYHSTNGAIQESLHVFINAGFRQCNKSKIRVLEIGFGTGLNALLTLLESENIQKEIIYHAIELFPLGEEIINQLNYSETLHLHNNEYFNDIHSSIWNTPIDITSLFQLKKIHADFTKIDFDETYDLIYFDAFSPDTQPEMWTNVQFHKMYKFAANDAILTTYCAKGEVRRRLQHAGFNVERIPGPKGKREMLRARKER